MRQHTARTAAIIAGVCLAACASPAGYKALDRGYGYSDAEIEQQHHRVTYRGNSKTTREEVEGYLMLRMAELAIERGAETFTVLDKETTCITTLQTSPTSQCTYRQSTKDMFPYFIKDLEKPWFRRLSPEQEFEATAHIVLGADPNCDVDPNCFEALFIASQLESLKQ